MSKIELTELKEMVSQNNRLNIRGHQFLDYINDIVALRECGVRCRIIADYLNQKLSLEGKSAINNNELSKLVTYWKERKLINFDEVKRVKAMIEGRLVERPANIEKPKIDDVDNTKSWFK